MEASALLPLSVTTFVVIAAALTLNSVGIYLLSQIKKRRTHQNLILKSLSLAEILLSILPFIVYPLKIHSLEKNHDLAFRIFYTTGTAVGMTYYLTMITLTLDRLAMCVLTIRYQIILTHRRMVITLISQWIISLAFSLLLFFLNLSLRSSEIVQLPFDFSFLAITMSTYFMIFRKLMNRKEDLQGEQTKNMHKENNTRSSNQDRHAFKFCFTSGLIILSFFVLVAVPNIVYVMVLGSDKSINVIDNHMLTFILIRQLNNVIDPCIYIFFQKNVRSLLKRKIKIGKNDLQIVAEDH